MTNFQPQIIGRIIAQLASNDLKKASNDEGVRPMLRIKGLERPEIMEAASILVKLQEDRGQPCELKISCRNPWPGCPSDWFLAEGETRAKYRNSARTALVLIDDEPEPDEQSLRNMHTLSDSAILIGAGESGERRRQQVANVVWSTVIERKDDDAPETLHSRCETVFEGYQAAHGDVSLRVWVGYLMEVVSKLAGTVSVVDSLEVEDAVSKALPALGMFPDAELFKFRAAAGHRRLVKNIHFAALRSDSGREIANEDIEKLIDEILFRCSDGEAYKEAENERWRDLCRRFLTSVDRTEIRKIPYRVWSQLFDKQSKKRKLGELIRETLEQECPDRIDELDDLDVIDGLDQSEAEAAEALLKTEPDDPEKQPLIDILPSRQRKAVEKLALPPSPYTDDPLTSLLRSFYELVGDAEIDGEPLEEPSNVSTLSISVETPGHDSAQLSLAAFRFLYASVLRQIADFENPGRPLEVSIAPELIDGTCNIAEVFQLLFPERAEDDEESEHNLPLQWAPLRFVVEHDIGGAHRFTWRPDRDLGRVAFARVCCEPDSWARFQDRFVSTEDWLERVPEMDKSLSPVPLMSESREFLDDYLMMRSAVFKRWACHGIAPDSLDDLIDAWSSALQRVRADFVPRGSSRWELDYFLDLDTLTVGGERTLLLATHPLRLRWISQYLQDVTKCLLATLEGSFRISQGAEGFYFSSRESLSPHRQPPAICTGHGSLSVAAREIGWNEEYARIEGPEGPSDDWMTTLDEASVDEMAQIVESYLQAHPHKRDGLSILFVSGDGEATHVERLVRRIMRRNQSEPPSIRVHVIAPPLAHDNIARTLEELDDTQKSADRMLPRLQTFLLSDELIEDPSKAMLAGQVDLALVPNLFGKKTIVLPQSRRKPHLPGGFNVLLHPSSYDQESGAEEVGENVSRALLPEAEDVLLESWSTLSVRRKVESTVTHDGDDLTDLFALRVRFTESLELFRSLHDWAHWVVTLDPFVGREQVESIENRPDIITVKPHVGKNGNYTLVVSSSAGREFVVTRLSRKIESDLRVASGEEARLLAEKIYDNGRTFAPGVVLRALGLGRASHELVGLLVSRWVVTEHYPPPGEGLLQFEAWLSLDEHARWFGGPNAKRADMLRVIGWREGDRLQVGLHVIESKFRSGRYVGTADTQVRKTMELVSNVFQGVDVRGDKSESADAPFWRSELIDALQQSASREREGAVFSGLAVNSGGSRNGGLPARIRQELFEGDYVVSDCRGIICSVAHGVELNDDGVTVRDSGYEWIQVGRTEMERILDAFGQGKSPVAIVIKRRAANDAGSKDEESSTTAASEETGTPDQQEKIVEASCNRVAADSEDVDDLGGRGMGSAELERRYIRILDAFDEFDNVVRKPEDGQLFAEGPAFYQVRVVPGRGVKPDTLMAQTNELKLKLSLPAELNIRAFVDRGAVVFQIPKVGSERYFVRAQEIWHKAPPDTTRLEVPLGEDAHGNIVSIDFSSSDSPHLLIGGTTGSGKSVVMEAILQGLCAFYDPSILRLKLIDPKGTELVDLEDDPHVDGPIGDFPEDAITLLESEVEEMQRRYKAMKARKCKTIVEYNMLVEPDERIPWHVVVLDEYADLTAIKSDRNTIEDNLKRLAQKARAAGIHLIVATQKPSAEVLSTSIRSNLPAQIALRVKTGSDSRMILEETGAETLAGKGDAFFKTADGVTRVQCAMYERPLSQSR